MQNMISCRLHLMLALLHLHTYIVAYVPNGECAKQYRVVRLLLLFYTTDNWHIIYKKYNKWIYYERFIPQNSAQLTIGFIHLKALGKLLYSWFWTLSQMNMHCIKYFNCFHSSQKTFTCAHPDPISEKIMVIHLSNYYQKYKICGKISVTNQKSDQ